MEPYGTRFQPLLAGGKVELMTLFLLVYAPGAISAHGTCTVHFPQTSLPTLLLPVPSSFVYELPKS